MYLAVVARRHTLHPLPTQRLTVPGQPARPDNPKRPRAQGRARCRPEACRDGGDSISAVMRQKCLAHRQESHERTETEQSTQKAKNGQEFSRFARIPTLQNDVTAKLAGISILKTRVRKKRRAMNEKRSLENEGGESHRSTEWRTVNVSQERCTAPIN